MPEYFGLNGKAIRELSRGKALKTNMPAGLFPE